MKSTPIRPPALALAKPIRVSTFCRGPGGSRSRTGCLRCCGSSAIASAASSARIRASTSAISKSVRAPSSRVARSSSSSSKTSASSSGSARTRPRISVSSSADALSSRSAIWAGLSLRMRANGPRSSALPSCPISHSKSCQSRAPGVSGGRRPNMRRGRMSTPATIHSGSSRTSSRSAARTRRAFGTSMSRWPNTSARSSTSPSLRSKWRSESRALDSRSGSPSKLLTWSIGTKISRPPTAATRPVTSG